jgi:hypothetical protein
MQHATSACDDNMRRQHVAVAACVSNMRRQHAAAACGGSMRRQRAQHAACGNTVRHKVRTQCTACSMRRQRAQRAACEGNVHSMRRQRAQQAACGNSSTSLPTPEPCSICLGPNSSNIHELMSRVFANIASYFSSAFCWDWLYFASNGLFNFHVRDTIAFRCRLVVVISRIVLLFGCVNLDQAVGAPQGRIALSLLADAELAMSSVRSAPSSLASGSSSGRGGGGGRGGGRGGKGDGAKKNVGTVVKPAKAKSKSAVLQGSASTSLDDADGGMVADGTDAAASTDRIPRQRAWPKSIFTAASPKCDDCGKHALDLDCKWTTFHPTALSNDDPLPAGTKCDGCSARWKRFFSHMAWTVYLAHMQTTEGKADLAEAMQSESGESTTRFHVSKVASKKFVGRMIYKRFRILDDKDYKAAMGKSRAKRHPEVPVVRAPSAVDGVECDHWCFADDDKPGRLMDVFCMEGSSMDTELFSPALQVFAAQADQVFDAAVDSDQKVALESLLQPTAKMYTVEQMHRKLQGEADVGFAMPPYLVTSGCDDCPKPIGESLSPALSRRLPVRMSSSEALAKLPRVGSASIVGSAEGTAPLEAAPPMAIASVGSIASPSGRPHPPAVSLRAGESLAASDDDEDQALTVDATETAYEKWTRKLSLQTVLDTGKLHVRKVQFAEDAILGMCKTDAHNMRKHLAQAVD